VRTVLGGSWLIARRGKIGNYRRPLSNGELKTFIAADRQNWSSMGPRLKRTKKKSGADEGMKTLSLLRFAVAVGVLFAPLPLPAQTFPGGSVKIIVPVPAGGVTDAIARVVGRGLSDIWGKPVIIENRPGGNYSVGVQAVAASPPDGLSLLVLPDATITANPHLFAKLAYDPGRDLTPIAPLCRVIPVLVINSSVPAKNVQELIALAKSKPGSLNYGSYGIGSYAHLSMEDFKRRTGTDIVHIPYRGAAPAATGLLGGEVSMLLLNVSSIEEHEKTGRVRILASASDQRSALKPDLPTVAESGVPGFSTVAWFGLFGPAKMPPDLAAKIHADVAMVLDTPQVKEYFTKNSFERVEGGPAEFVNLITRDSDHWGELVRSLNIKLE
jgi:tripartite-type tricarboxylate transporter receptor subunit TctC